MEDRWSGGRQQMTEALRQTDRPVQVPFSPQVRCDLPWGSNSVIRCDRLVIAVLTPWHSSAGCLVSVWVTRGDTGFSQRVSGCYEKRDPSFIVVIIWIVVFVDAVICYVSEPPVSKHRARAFWHVLCSEIFFFIKPRSHDWCV